MEGNQKKKENNNGCSGCLGCFGIIFLILLLIGGCSAIFTDDNSNDDTDKITEERSKPKEAVDKGNSEVQKKSKKKDKETPSNNTVYGKLTKKHNNTNPVVIGDMTYILGDDDEILQAEKDFSNLPLDKNTDKNFLNEHAKDLMTKDAELVSNKSDTEQKYHSKSLNKDYYVTLSLTDDGNVRSLIVSSFE